MPAPKIEILDVPMLLSLEVHVGPHPEVHVGTNPEAHVGPNPEVHVGLHLYSGLQDAIPEPKIDISAPSGDSMMSILGSGMQPWSPK